MTGNYGRPPGASTVCVNCGERLIACYPNQQLHPLCDPNPPVLTDEQIDHWAARANEEEHAP